MDDILRRITPRDDPSQLDALVERVDKVPRLVRQQALREYESLLQ